jgi:hypothetical protein
VESVIASDPVESIIAPVVRHASVWGGALGVTGAGGVRPVRVSPRRRLVAWLRRLAGDGPATGKRRMRMLARWRRQVRCLHAWAGLVPLVQGEVNASSPGMHRNHLTAPRP